MIQSERISVFQFYLPIFVGIITTGVLTMPLVLYQAAEQNLWLPLIVGSLSGYVAVAVVSYLYHCYPQQTIIEILQQRMGRVIGTGCALLLILCLVLQGVYITREYQMYLSINFLFVHAAFHSDRFTAGRCFVCDSPGHRSLGALRGTLCAAHSWDSSADLYFDHS
ncbi:hypothetical protein NBRC111894_1825 [Sporolactobacillus inulinus]|uniref:Spore germination protein n=1 Tax=Sporolactobacillus inulinus TaxID=2078 RepID=A0A4Y1ZBG7_9BACL|nr:spore germination protein [Sporolactobacillus inulinus]GAY76271.1 hypothetical protein NBRC111894_1825 [Sporolactobacillus inulinus]